jgi:hypothetical protein
LTHAVGRLLPSFKGALEEREVATNTVVVEHETTFAPTSGHARASCLTSRIPVGLPQQDYRGVSLLKIRRRLLSSLATSPGISSSTTDSAAYAPTSIGCPQRGSTTNPSWPKLQKRPSGQPSAQAVVAT